MANSLPQAQVIQGMEAKHTLETYRIASCNPVPTVLYITTVQELDTALQDFDGPYGFDCEWKCMPRDGRIALVQLSNGAKVLLVHVCLMPEFPVRLKALLEDATIAKIGVALEGDGKRLKDDYNITANNLVNLGPLASAVDEGFRKEHVPKWTSLTNISAYFLRLFLPKGPVRISNWERAPLTEDQREYAACDAHSAIEIYRLLIERANMGDIDLSHCGHIADINTGNTNRSSSRCPMHFYEMPEESQLTINEHDVYFMWHNGYSSVDIQQTMVQYKLPGRTTVTDDMAVMSFLVSALTRDPKLHFDEVALRAFAESDPAISSRYADFLAARCPVATLNVVPEIEETPIASSSESAIAERKRKDPPNARNDDELASHPAPGDTQESKPPPAPPALRRSLRLQSTTSQQSSGRAVKRARIT